MGNIFRKSIVTLAAGLCLPLSSTGFAQSLTITPASSTFGPEGTSVRMDFVISNPEWAMGNSTMAAITSQLEFFNNGNYIGGISGHNLSHNMGDDTAYVSCLYRVTASDVTAGQINFSARFRWESFFGGFSAYNEFNEMDVTKSVTLTAGPTGVGGSGLACYSSAARISTANAGPNQLVMPGSVVTLDGSASTQPDGLPLEYKWKSQGNQVWSFGTTSGVNPTFTAPNVSSPTTLNFFLHTRPQDEYDTPFSASSMVSITIDPDANGTAICNPENDALLPTSVSGGGTFVFSIPIAQVCTDDVFWIDPPVAVGYTYEAIGTTFTHVQMPSTASVPDPDGYVLVNGNKTVRLQAGEAYEFPSPVSSFIVRNINPDLGTDPEDEMAFPIGIEVTAPTSDVTIKQTPIVEEWPPVFMTAGPEAIAGPDQTAQSGNTVQLDGSASADADGDPVTYFWTQTSGPSVSLSNQTDMNPIFTAPTVSASTTLTFSLSVKDPSGSQSEADMVNVIIEPSTSHDGRGPFGNRKDRRVEDLEDIKDHRARLRNGNPNPFLERRGIVGRPNSQESRPQTHSTRDRDSVRAPVKSPVRPAVNPRGPKPFNRHPNAPRTGQNPSQPLGDSFTLASYGLTPDAQCLIYMARPAAMAPGLQAEINNCMNTPALAGKPLAGVIVTGHTDTYHPDAQSMAESMQFAQFVGNFLQQSNPGTTVITQAKGETALFQQTGDGVQEQLNRFVDIRVYLDD